jgi:DNA-binding MarR family transcriptional regulator
LLELEYIELNESKKDMREKHISLTEEGEKIFIECRKKAIPIQGRLVNEFLPDEVSSLTKYLEIVNKRIPSE